MGKQYNKKQKRVRRKYVERRNARVRSGVAQA
jgi:hypothetical protein